MSRLRVWRGWEGERMTAIRRQRKHEHNPHGLTDRQVEMMDLMRSHGSWVQVGKLTGTTRQNVMTQVTQAAEKIGVGTPLLALLAWDRMKNKPVSRRRRIPADHFECRF